MIARALTAIRAAWCAAMHEGWMYAGGLASQLWCAVAHREEFWPISGTARCKTCLRVRRIGI